MKTQTAVIAKQSITKKNFPITLDALLLRNRQRHLPQSLVNAAGLLGAKYSDLKKHYLKVRKEWAARSVSDK